MSTTRAPRAFHWRGLQILGSQSWGGRISDILTGIELRGAGGGGPGFHLGRGTTQLVWTGAADQVVIDLPAPWYCKLSDFSIDGNWVPGLIGIRYRAAWEFGHDGGKHNVFERISMTGVEVGFHVGGPFSPDLVASSFRNIVIEGMHVGMRFVGANVAEQWVENSHFNNWSVAGIQLVGHAGPRVIRPLSSRGVAPPAHSAVFEDADGREIFVEQIPPYVLNKPPTKKGPGGTYIAGGGGPSVVMTNIVASSKKIKTGDAPGWLVDSNGPSVRLQGVRMEGNAGLVRNTGRPLGSPPEAQPIASARFQTVLIDVNYAGNPARLIRIGPIIQHDANDTLTIVGGSIGGGGSPRAVSLGTNTTAYVVGLRLLYGGSFVQIPGTTGAVVHRLGEASTHLDLQSSVPSSPSSTLEDRMRAMESRMIELEASNRELKSQLSSARGQN